MALVNKIFTVDSHVAGEPLRLITGGLPHLKGKSVAEKKAYFETRFDHIRKALILEPRGHDNMFGAVLCEPVDPSADAGIFFMHTGGYLNMCGHGTIGAVTSIIDGGLLDRDIGRTAHVVLETPAGLISASTTVQDGVPGVVTIRNVPSFILQHDFRVNLPNLGTVQMDIAYAGNFFGLIPAEELSLKVDKEHLSQMISLGMELKDIINDSGVKIYHPDDRSLNSIEIIVIYEPYEHKLGCWKNCVVFGNGQVDRSPCGSGTSALLALNYSKRRLHRGESLINHSIIGTKFSGTAIKETKVGNFDAIVPQIEGKAIITGYHQFIIDRNDPLNEGFSLNQN